MADAGHKCSQIRLLIELPGNLDVAAMIDRDKRAEAAINKN